MKIRKQGVRGGEMSAWKALGRIDILIDDSNRKDGISIDAYSGSGETYSKREKSLINISDESGVFWSGSFEELKKKLKS